jgi:hypothetical protein
LTVIAFIVLLIFDLIVAEYALSKTIKYFFFCSFELAIFIKLIKAYKTLTFLLNKHHELHFKDIKRNYEYFFLIEAVGSATLFVFYAY